MSKQFKVSQSTKWRLGENVVLQLMECFTISHLFVCLPSLELTTFEEHVCSTKLGYRNALSLGTNNRKKKECGHFEQCTPSKKVV